MRSRIGKFVASVALCATCAFSGENAPAKQQDAPALDLLKASADSIAKVDAAKADSLPVAAPVDSAVVATPSSLKTVLYLGGGERSPWFQLGERSPPPR